MEEYVKWLEKMIEETLNDRDMSRKHWAFCQSLKIYRETHHIIEKACVNCKFNKSETYHDKMWCRDCQRMNHFVSQSEGEKQNFTAGSRQKCYLTFDGISSICITKLKLKNK